MKSLIILLVLVNCMYICKAQPGTIDKSFGDNGIVYSETYSAFAYALTTQTDNKTIISGMGGYGDTGGLFLVRYNTDGSIDESFGNAGRVVVSVSGSSNGYFNSVKQIADGKIIASGLISKTFSDVILARFNNDGSIDSSFGNNGIVITSIGKSDYPRDMAVQEDGKIVITGDKQEEENDNSTSFTARYLSDGQLDQSFGNNGIVVTVFNEEINIEAIKVQSDKKVLISGMYNFLGPAPVFLVVRYLEDGTLDYEFGSNGLAKINLQADATFAELNDLEIQKDGRIIVGGTSALNGIQKRITIGRFTQTGLPDQSFGKNGYVITPIEEKESQVNGLLIQSDGKILGGGSVFERAAADGNFILLRYKDNGTLDSTFGDNGITIIEINGDARSIGIEFDQDAQILIAGNTYVTELPGNLVALARYNNDKPEKNKYLRIKHWLHHHGITWEDKPNNLINYYSIQSSTNGNVFSEVARIFSNHHGGIQTYTAANNATANYRVAAVSNTGNITYSNTLTLTATPTIQLYPNPAKNILQIQGLPAGTTKLMVTDISGNTRLIATANSTVYSIHIAQLTSGNYLLHIKTANEVITKQFIKE